MTFDLHEHNHVHTPPWMYVRDEIDVLEEAFDRLVRGHRASPPSPRRAIEASVLREQRETEEGNQPRLAPEGEIEAPERPIGVGCAEEILLGGDPILARLKRDAERDPLYALAARWGKGAVRYAAPRYAKASEGESELRDLFRLLVNGHLVPAKVAFGLGEEAHIEEDQEGKEDAKREYGFAQTYLSRALRSLENVCEKRDIEAAGLLQEGAALSLAIEARAKRLDDLPSFGRAV